MTVRVVFPSIVCSPQRKKHSPYEKNNIKSPIATRVALSPLPRSSCNRAQEDIITTTPRTRYKSTFDYKEFFGFKSLDNYQPLHRVELPEIYDRPVSYPYVTGTIINTARGRIIHILNYFFSFLNSFRRKS